jgi:glycosyltransferase involved in cell wall biosynthesis
VPNKRLEAMLEVAADLARRVPGATLTVVGAVEQRNLPYWSVISQRYQELKLGKVVHFAGQNADVFSLLREFRVFAMLSWAQGCPNACLEAMAAGLPVVANNDGGTADQVENERTGFLVSGDCPQEMALRIEDLLRDPAKAQRFGRAGQQKVHSQYSMGAMVQHYAKVLWPTHVC